MPLSRVDLNKHLDPLEYLVPGYILKGYVNFFAALQGVGKTVLLTYLAWQMSRPNGGEFLGEDVPHGTSIYVDFDAPSDGRGFRYWLDKHKQAFPDGDQSKIILLEPDPDTYALQEGEVSELANLTRETKWLVNYR